jgi:hypothetical protein
MLRSRRRWIRLRRSDFSPFSKGLLITGQHPASRHPDVQDASVVAVPPASESRPLAR